MFLLVHGIKHGVEALTKEYSALAVLQLQPRNGHSTSAGVPAHMPFQMTPEPSSK